MSLPRMFTAFGRVFWGLLLTLLDVNLGQLDILPDVVGYALIATGCSGLAQMSRHFALAAGVSWLLVALALAALVVEDAGFALFWMITDGALMWLVLTGVMDLATARARPDLAGRAAGHRLAYVVLVSAAVLTGLITGELGDVGTVLTVVWVACLLPLLFVILRLILTARDELVAASTA